MDDPKHADEVDRSEQERVMEERQREEIQMEERRQREDKRPGMEVRWRQELRKA